MRIDKPCLHDQVWDCEVLSEPAAIKQAIDFADAVDAVKYFDAGDIQANGFQLLEDEREGLTVNDTASSFMGFAASGILSHALSDDGKYPIAFCGDGSFTMNPQILIDGVEHGLRGCIIVFDNRRMAAISSLQRAQYGVDYKTNDSVRVDYAAWANSVTGVLGISGWGGTAGFACALRQAYEFKGLSLIHVPVYSGDASLGGLGVFGDWNVGNWCERVQAERHRIGL